MNGPKHDNLMPSVLLTLSVGLCFAWLAGWITNDGWWAVRIVSLAIGLAVASGAALWLEYNRRQDSRLAERHFEALWKINTQAMYTDLGDAGIPPLSPNNPWYDLSERVRETIMRLYRRIQELEQSRASLEVRCRRMAVHTERIAKVLDDLSDPIFAIDNYDEITLANQSAKEVLSLGDDAASRSLKQLAHCEKLVQLLTSTRQRKNASHRTDELEIVDREGQSHWYRATAIKPQNSVPDQMEDGGVVAVLRDIGDQKAMQKRNAEFVSSVSHEMKTPLAGIKAYVELLADGDAEDEKTREEFLGVINSQTDRLQRLVDNLLNIARIEAGVIHVCKEPRSLNEVLEEAIRVVQPTAEAKQIQLISELSPMYLGVLADRDLLLQAAINLLSNAVKYTPSGGKVWLRSRLADTQIRFEVQDTGVGLSKEDCDKVFEKFYRVKKDKEMASGTGLGLPLAKHIVEDVHRGHLTLESKPGVGSTFIVTLPRAGQATTLMATNAAGNV